MQAAIFPVKKEKKPKATAPKPDTKEASLALFQSGKNIAEIAKERSLTQNTIEAHLATYIASGVLDISLFMNEEKLSAIEDAFRTQGQ